MLRQQTFSIFMNQKFQYMIFTQANDIFIVWPSSVTLTFNLSEQMFQMNICAILFWNPFINAEIMGRTSSIYDHFIIWPSSVTLTFNLPEQMFQMNNCATLFWNPFINVEVMIMKLSLWLFYHLTFKCDLDLQPTWTNVSYGTATPQGEQLSQIISKSMHKCCSYCLDKYRWTHAQCTHTELKL